MRKQIIGSVLIAIALWAALSSFQSVMAQSGRQFGTSRSNWFPQGNPSALSPWLEMERASTSELDTYNQYVRPRLEMERYLMARQREMNMQRDQQQTLQNEVTRMQIQNYQFYGEASPTGKGATFRNYLHFYPRKK